MNKIIYLKNTSSEHKQEAFDFATELNNKLKEHKLGQEIRVVHVADIGVYNCGLVFRILPHDYLYKDVTIRDLANIVEKSIIGDERIQELSTDRPSKQKRVVLRNCGAIDPENIGDYIATGGYQGIATALENGPDYVIDEMKTSGLRGRGGAGFLTWMKWNLTRGVEGEQKYIICNGDEAIPGRTWTEASLKAILIRLLKE
jgi:(2Fe-2S) ferredoxin